MRQKKTKWKAKLIAAVLVLALLGGAWLLGASAEPVEVLALPLPTEEPAETVEQAPLPEADEAAPSPDEAVAAEAEESPAAPEAPEPPETPAETPSPASNPSPTPDPAPTPLPEAPAPTPLPPTPTPDLPPAPPEEPENDGTFTITLSVRVDTLLHNMHLLDEDKHELVPAGGVIFSRTVTVTEGESVFDVLLREMRQAGIHMTSRFTPLYNSAYVEAIHNLFEFDAGPLSGWKYRVNGYFPSFGASLYILNPGDVVDWMYTVDLGRDIGGRVG